jgi:hypothetical protein
MKKVRADTERISLVLGNFANKESVSALLKQFDLDKAIYAKKSPLELFEIAWAAFEKPVTDHVPEITSLVPIRECIMETVETLLRRRQSRNLPRMNMAKLYLLQLNLLMMGFQRKRSNLGPINGVQKAV